MHASQLHRLARQVREIALIATGNTGEERVSVGEVLVVEDVAAHPRSSIKEITERTRLAQSLVSRIVATMREHGIFTSEQDPFDGRKTLVSVDQRTRESLLRERGARPIDEAIATTLPRLEPTQVKRLHRLLQELTGLLESGR